MMSRTSIVENITGGFIVIFLIWVAERVWNLELSLPKKLGIFAFIIAASFFVIWRLSLSLRGLKIKLYLKGYRFSSLTWDKIFKRYGGRDKFVGKNDFYIPFIEIFCNKEGLEEEDFPAKIVRDENGKTKRYNLPLAAKVIEDVREFNRKGRIWDDHTGRFIKLEHIKDTTKSKVVLHFEITTYFDYLASNLYVDTFVPSLGMTIRDRLEGNVPEKALDNLSSANHGGVTALLLCSDKQLILLQNRSDNATYPNQICASTSGTLEAEDILDGSKPSPPFHALRREMREELHLQPSDLEELRLLAITRDMTRGGTPEFIFFAKTGLISGDVAEDFSFAYKDNHDNPQEIKSVRQKGFITHDIHLHFSSKGLPENNLSDFQSPSGFVSFLGTIE